MTVSALFELAKTSEAIMKDPSRGQIVSIVALIACESLAHCSFQRKPEIT